MKNKWNKYARHYFVALCGELLLSYVDVWACNMGMAYRIAVKKYGRDKVGGVYTPLMWSRKYTYNLTYLGEVE